MLSISIVIRREDEQTFVTAKEYDLVTGVGVDLMEALKDFGFQLRRFWRVERQKTNKKGKLVLDEIFISERERHLRGSLFVVGGN